MYNQGRVKIFRIGVLIISCLMSLVIGGAIGYSIAGNQASKQEGVVQPEGGKETRLSTEVVKEFLIAYYTKKDISENRDRYKELMTEQMYRQEVAQEETPVNQAYKGYLLNQVYDKATIYIDENTLTVLTEVDYHNIQTTKKNNPEVGVTMYEKATLKINFVKQGEQYLVNSINHLGALLQKSEVKNTAVETKSEATTSQTTKREETTQSAEKEESTTTTTVTLRGRLW